MKKAFCKMCVTICGRFARMRLHVYIAR
ncbi:DUF6783 domain-containing protein [uncultured Clostridium sp.]